MTVSSEERDRILRMVESGQLSAEEAAQLLDALVAPQPPSHTIPRTIRVWFSEMGTRRPGVRMTATLPLNLVSGSLHLLSRAMPQLNEAGIQRVLNSLEQGATGRVLDMQDLEEGKRLEIFIEP
jgi:hypothetical protein